MIEALSMEQYSARPHRPTNKISVARLHAAIRDNHWSDFPLVLRDQPNILFKPSPRGWNAIHVATVSRLEDSRWQWLLHNALKVSNGANLLTETSTDTGQTAIDLYFRYNLYPFIWQSHSIRHRARNIRIAMQNVRTSPPLLDSFIRELGMHFCNGAVHEVGKIDTSPNNDQMASSVRDPELQMALKFWKNLKPLLVAIFVSKFKQESTNSSLRDIPILQILATLRWCPSLVVEMAVEICRLQTQRNPYPLHIWCQTETAIDHNGVHGMGDILCREFPEVAAVVDTTSKQLPLHTAIYQGKTWNEVFGLFQAYPTALLLMDGRFGLPTFCLPTLRKITLEEAEAAAKRHDPRLLSIWRYISGHEKRNAIDRARERLELQRLENIYQVLRRNPAVLNMAMRK